MVIVCIPSSEFLVFAVDFLSRPWHAIVLVSAALIGVVSSDTDATTLEYHVLTSYFHILLVFLFKLRCNFFS